MQIKLFFTRKGFAHSLVLKIRVLRTQKMPIVSVFICSFPILRKVNLNLTFAVSANLILNLSNGASFYFTGADDTSSNGSAPGPHDPRASIAGSNAGPAAAVVAVSVQFSTWEYELTGYPTSVKCNLTTLCSKTSLIPIVRPSFLSCGFVNCIVYSLLPDPSVKGTPSWSLPFSITL